jgi:hypothetical protein
MTVSPKRKALPDSFFAAFFEALAAFIFALVVVILDARFHFLEPYATLSLIIFVPLVFLLLLIAFFFPLRHFVHWLRNSSKWAGQISRLKKSCIRSFYLFVFRQTIEADILRILENIRQQLFSHTVTISIDRTGQEYKAEIENLIHSSSKVYILGATGHSFFNEDRESFVTKALLTHSIGDQAKQKDVRFKFMNCDSNKWEARADWFLERLKKAGNTKYATTRDYKEECQKNCNLLLSAWPGSVRYYNSDPYYRMLIFDDCLFISLYGTFTGAHCSTFEREEGHLTTVVKIKNTASNPLYNVFSCIYESL